MGMTMFEDHLERVQGENLKNQLRNMQKERCVHVRFTVLIMILEIIGTSWKTKLLVNNRLWFTLFNVVVEFAINS